MPWASIRTFVILLHVLAVIVLSLPSTGRMTDRRVWTSENAKRDLENWSETLGFESPEVFENRLWSLTQRYAAVKNAIAKPFEIYANLSGARQGWSMFSNPQKHPAELHIDVRRSGKWQPIYRPHSEEYSFQASLFRHNRIRKLTGRFARTFYSDRYSGFAQHIARDAARAYPDATNVRVRLYRYATPAPHRSSQTSTSAPYYEHVRAYPAASLK